MGFWQTTRSIIAKPGGILNLYNGLGITMVRCIPANALIFYTYELLKQNFKTVCRGNCLFYLFL